VLKIKRLTTICLLLIFGFTLAKDIIFSKTQGIENCEEFGHIHKYKLTKHSVTVGFHKISDDDDECHGAKSIFSSVAILTQAHQFPSIINPAVKIFQKQKFFKNLYLEPRLKPPSFS
jgi:hypothetical protein